MMLTFESEVMKKYSNETFNIIWQFQARLHGFVFSIKENIEQKWSEVRSAYFKLS